MIYTHPMLAVLPGLAIVAMVLGLNLMGDGLRDALDPRLRSGGMIIRTNNRKVRIFVRRSGVLP
jgi:hypothetical protein